MTPDDLSPEMRADFIDLHRRWQDHQGDSIACEGQKPAQEAGTPGYEVRLAAQV